MTTATPAAAWHHLHILKLDVKTGARRLGIGTSEFWSLVAQHKLAREARYDERAVNAPADDEEALDPAKKVEAENVAWRARRRAQLRAQGLQDTVIDERIGFAGSCDAARGAYGKRRPNED
jgi:hypothetical protein